MHTYFLPLVKIHELCTLDVNETVSDFLNLARNQIPQENVPSGTEEIKIIQDPQYRRLKSSIDMKLALKLYNTYR